MSRQPLRILLFQAFIVTLVAAHLVVTRGSFGTATSVPGWIALGACIAMLMVDRPA